MTAFWASVGVSAAGVIVSLGMLALHCRRDKREFSKRPPKVDER